MKIGYRRAEIIRILKEFICQVLQPCLLTLTTNASLSTSSTALEAIEEILNEALKVGTTVTDSKIMNA